MKKKQPGGDTTGGARLQGGEGGHGTWCGGKESGIEAGLWDLGALAGDRFANCWQSELDKDCKSSGGRGWISLGVWGWVS